MSVPTPSRAALTEAALTGEWTTARAQHTSIAALHRRVAEADGTAPFGTTAQARHDRFDDLLREVMAAYEFTDDQAQAIIVSMVDDIRSA